MATELKDLLTVQINCSRNLVVLITIQWNSNRSFLFIVNERLKMITLVLFKTDLVDLVAAENVDFSVNRSDGRRRPRLQHRRNLLPSGKKEHGNSFGVVLNEVTQFLTPLASPPPLSRLLIPSTIVTKSSTPSPVAVTPLMDDTFRFHDIRYNSKSPVYAFNEFYISIKFWKLKNNSRVL